MGYVGIEEDYYISVKSVLDITAETGALTTQSRIRELTPADVVPVEILKAEIYKLKCQQDSKNQDYYTGYMSALSTVEGILAWMDEKE